MDPIKREMLILSIYEKKHILLSLQYQLRTLEVENSELRNLQKNRVVYRQKSNIFFLEDKIAVIALKLREFETKKKQKETLECEIKRDEESLQRLS